MNDVATPIKDSLLRDLAGAAAGHDDPSPPSSYFMASIEMMAMSVFENNRKLTQWMKERGLNPHNGPDAVLGVGILLTLDQVKNPRPEPSEDFEFPDEHHH